MLVQCDPPHLIRTDFETSSTSSCISHPWTASRQRLPISPRVFCAPVWISECVNHIVLTCLATFYYYYLMQSVLIVLVLIIAIIYWHYSCVVITELMLGLFFMTDKPFFPPHFQLIKVVYWLCTTSTKRLITDMSVLYCAMYWNVTQLYFDVFYLFPVFFPP